jgi:hypothetical protein
MFIGKILLFWTMSFALLAAFFVTTIVAAPTPSRGAVVAKVDWLPEAGQPDDAIAACTRIIETNSVNTTVDARADAHGREGEVRLAMANEEPITGGAIAVAKIEKLGGRFEKNGNGEVIKVSLSGTNVTDATRVAPIACLSGRRSRTRSSWQADLFVCLRHPD